MRVKVKEAKGANEQGREPSSGGTRNTEEQSESRKKRLQTRNNGDVTRGEKKQAANACSSLSNEPLSEDIVLSKTLGEGVSGIVYKSE